MLCYARKTGKIALLGESRQRAGRRQRSPDIVIRRVMVRCTGLDKAEVAAFKDALFPGGESGRHIDYAHAPHHESLIMQPGTADRRGCAKHAALQLVRYLPGMA